MIFLFCYLLSIIILIHYIVTGVFITPHVSNIIYPKGLLLIGELVNIYIKIKSWFFTNSTIENETLKIKYTFNGEEYIVSSPLKFGLKPIVKIIKITPCVNKNGANDFLSDDITNNIKPYLGPNGNFHGIPTTPKMLGINSAITVTYRNEKVKVYEPNEIIMIDV